MTDETNASGHKKRNLLDFKKIPFEARLDIFIR